MWSIIAYQLPWLFDYFQGLEREVAEAENASEEQRSECIMRLSWALVHSRRPEDVQRGMAMVEGKLDTSINMDSSYVIYV